MTLSRNGNLRLMLIGFNHASRLLEIGLELIHEELTYVFHGQPVSPKYRKLYEELIANE